MLGGDLNVAHQNIDIYDHEIHQKIPGFVPKEKESFTEFLKSGSNGGFFDTYRYFHPRSQQYSFWNRINHVGVQSYNSRLYNRGWRLDYFVLSRSCMPYAVDSLIHNDYLGSDHCPIELQIDLTGDAFKERGGEVEDVVTALGKG